MPGAGQAPRFRAGSFSCPEIAADSGTWGGVWRGQSAAEFDAHARPACEENSAQECPPAAAESRCPTAISGLGESVSPTATDVSALLKN